MSKKRKDHGKPAADQHADDAAVHQGAPEGGAGEAAVSTAAETPGDPPADATAGAGNEEAEGSAERAEQDPPAAAEDDRAGVVTGGEGDGEAQGPAAEGAEHPAAPGSSDPDGQATAAAGDQAGAAAAAEASPPPPKNRINVNVLAAVAAAAVAFGTTEEDGTTLPRWDSSWVGPDSDATREAVQIAANFLRSSRDAAPETLVIELQLKGFRDLPEPTGRRAVAWRIFTFVLNQLDAFDAAEKARAEAEAWAARQETSRKRGARREDLAMLPYDNNPLTDIASRARGARR